MSKLIHPIFEKVPLVIRFVLSGVVGNGCFMIAYNATYRVLQMDASIVFAIVQFFCIILNHFLNVSLVFGYPENYTKSLLANMPVGLSSLAMGAFLASYLEKSGFDTDVHNFMHTLLKKEEEDIVDEEGGSFYTSIAVMLATGIYNFIVLNIINKPADKEKKEL
mmetsp:Transcript_38475/g.42547  ORF Transcript_38475/g.42547 Transcript_38475/m.42547 type:complete len:164 (+) Transcript_38475:163-654(+)